MDETTMKEQRRIQLDFYEEGIRVTARLLPDLAPVTAEAIWNLAALEPKLVGVHAAFTGRELSVRVPTEAAEQVPGLDALPPENQTVLPLPGDLVWAYLPPYAWSGVAEPIFDLGVFYGRDSRILLPMGWVPGNRFAQVEEDDLAALADVCSRAQTEGKKLLVVRRLG